MWVPIPPGAPQYPLGSPGNAGGWVRPPTPAPGVQRLRPANLPMLNIPAATPGLCGASEPLLGGRPLLLPRVLFCLCVTGAGDTLLNPHLHLVMSNAAFCCTERRSLHSSQVLAPVTFDLCMSCGSIFEKAMRMASGQLIYNAFVFPLCLLPFLVYLI